MKLALFDIDGYLANDLHRTPFAINREWADYFRPDRVLADTLYAEGKKQIYDMIADGWNIAYLTGRREDLRSVTLDWFDLHGLPYGGDIFLQMKQFGETSTLADYKLRIMQELWSGESTDYDLDRLVLFDDDPEVVRVIQEHMGLTFAQGCAWHTKPSAMVRLAVA
jgi:hypothetical protein